MAIQYAPLFALETQFQTKDGRNNTGGWLKVFLAATDDPATTYSDYNGTRNPEKIVLDDDGRAVVICDKSKAYRLEVYSIDGSLLWTEEPVYCSGTGGGGVSITKVVSTDGSISVDDSVAGSTTTYDIGLAPKDSDEFLEWIKCSEKECGATWYPVFQDGSMETEAGKGIKVHKGHLYHFTNSFTVDPDGTGVNYDTFRVAMYCGDDIVDEHDFDIDSSLNDQVLCEFSRDVVPSEDTHVYFKLTIPTTCKASGEVQCHRIYSGINAVPDTCATKQWVSASYQTLSGMSSYVPYSAGKLANARELAVGLSNTSTTTTFDGSANVTNIKVSGQLPVANGGTGSNTAAGARTNLSVYSKSEIDSLMSGRVEIVTELPATGKSGVTYYVGPTGSGADKYDEYIWTGSAFLKVGEHSLDLSNYVNTVATSGSGSVVTGVSKSGNTVTVTKGNISLDDLSDWATETDVTISNVTYHTMWPVAPTSSNQVYGISINNGRLFRIYNNKGAYSVQAYDKDSDTTYTPQKLGIGYGTCTTAEATAAKVVTLADYTLVKNGIVAVKFSYPLCTSATLNINGKGAKPVYVGGAAVTATNCKSVQAGDIGYFIYDGTAYHFLGTDRAGKSAITGLSVSGKTVTYTRSDGETGTFDTQDTTYSFADGYNASTNKGATVATVTNAINALDVSDISGFGAGKTLATLKEENGKISATFQDISITKSQVSDFSHAHGNIQNGGTLQTNDITIANGDKLVVTDSSDSSKVARASIAFDGSTTTKALTPKGTFEAFAKSGDITTAIQALDVSSVGGDGKYISAISETDGKISATATSLATAPVSGSAVAITAGGVYTALAAKQDAIPDAGSAANPVHFKDGKAVAGDSINNCKLTLKVGDATVGDGFTANAGADFEYRVTGEQIASALTAGRGISISGKTVSTKLPLSEDNEATVKKGVWYIFAMANVTNGTWERCWDFLIASNHNSSAQMRLFISPRISASGSIESDTVVQVEGHVTPAQLAKYKIATVKDSSGKLYCCLCVNHSNSNENRTVQWNLRNARGISWRAESTPLSNYTVVSERLLNAEMSSNRLVCYKPTNKAAVGNATNPVYVDEYGMIKACSSMPKFVIGTPAGAANTIYFT